MKRLTPIKAIRQYCIACSGGSRAEVANCEIDDCTLYPYRMGHRPAVKAENEKPQPLRETPC
jgi:predicted NAD/FAD-binding protein